MFPQTRMPGIMVALVTRSMILAIQELIIDNQLQPSTQILDALILMGLHSISHQARAAGLIFRDSKLAN